MAAILEQGVQSGSEVVTALAFFGSGVFAKASTNKHFLLDALSSLEASENLRALASLSEFWVF